VRNFHSVARISNTGSFELCTTRSAMLPGNQRAGPVGPCVDMAMESDPTLVLETVALTLDMDKSPHWSLIVSLIEHLHEKSLLPILDHCDRVLGTCPDLRILVTSQQPLNISEEKHYRLVH